MLHRPRPWIGLLLAAVALGGCASFGPERLARDRSAYVDRLRDSEKAQLLSNIVALHYGDAPFFLSITSLINQYTRERSGRVTINPWQEDNESGMGAAILLRETPTVTYTPMAGERFAKNLLAPIPPATVVSLMEAGWPADVLLTLSTRSLNGVRNRGLGALLGQAGDADFDVSVAALRRLQADGALSIRVTERDKGFSASAHLRPTLTGSDKADLALLRRTLGLEAGAAELKIVFAAQSAAPDELAIATRSMLEVLLELGEGVAPLGATGDQAAPIVIASGPAAPADAYAAVRRGEIWFWISASDERSKRAFLIVQILMSLNDALAAGGTPLIVLPAG